MGCRGQKNICRDRESGGSGTGLLHCAGENSSARMKASCQMKTIFKVINMLTIFTLCLFVFILLYCFIIIHLYKPCLFFAVCIVVLFNSQ